MNSSIPLRALLAGLLIAAPICPADTVAKYALDGNADDSSGHDYHGVVNGATFVEDDDRGMVASFDGVSGSINVAASGYSITERPNFQFAISFWFKPEARDDYAPGGAIDTNPIMGATGSGVIELVGHGAWPGMGGVPAYGGVGVNSGGGAGSVAAVAGLDLYDGNWHHVVIQWTDPDGVPSDYTLNGGSDATVYLDNQLAVDVNSQTYNGNSGQAMPTMVLGGPVVYSNGGPADKYYKGLLSDVRFFDNQLTAEDVDELFNEPSPAADPLGLAVTSDPGGSDLLFTWNSRSGKAYTLRTSEELTTDPLGWEIVSADLAATPPTNTLTIPRPGDSQRFYVVIEHAPPPLFFDDFESDLGWTAGSDGEAGTVWERGIPTLVGPLAAFSPVNCHGTNLAADYTSLCNVWLCSPLIDLTDPNLTAAALTFQQFKDFEDPPYEEATITFLDAVESPLAPAIPVTGASIDWSELTIPVPAAAIGQFISIEFRFRSDSELEFSGWYIDDVAVSAR